MIALLQDPGAMVILLAGHDDECAGCLADRFAVMDRGETGMSGALKGMTEDDVRRFLAF